MYGTNSHITRAIEQAPTYHHTLRVSVCMYVHAYKFEHQIIVKRSLLNLVKSIVLM